MGPPAELSRSSSPKNVGLPKVRCAVIAHGQLQGPSLRTSRPQRRSAVCVPFTLSRKGFDLKTGRRGDGLTNLEVRAEVLGGTVSIERASDGHHDQSRFIPVICWSSAGRPSARTARLRSSFEGCRCNRMSCPVTSSPGREPRTTNGRPAMR